MSLEEKIAEVKAKIAAAAHEVGRDPAEITLVAATKVQDAETVRAAIKAGVAICGENRVQEMTEKLAQDAYQGASLHFIGHLQTNKVKQVVGAVDLLESVGSLRLLEAVEAQAAKLNLVQDILIEVNVGAEASKGGVPPEELLELAHRAQESAHLRLRGLMAIPPVAKETGGNRQFFAYMYQLFVDIRTAMDHNRSDIDCLSMGMSMDFEDAVREGATLVRVGTALFGLRPPMRQS